MLAQFFVACTDDQIRILVVPMSLPGFQFQHARRFLQFVQWSKREWISAVDLPDLPILIGREHCSSAMVVVAVAAQSGDGRDVFFQLLSRDSQKIAARR